MNRLIVVLILSVAAGCQSPLDTGSGYPEAIVERSSTPVIRSVAVEVMTGSGYRFLGPDAVGLVFEKQAAAVGDEIYGSEDGPPRLVVRIHILKTDEGHRLMATGAIVVRHGIFEEEIAPDRTGYLQIADLLERIQKEIAERDE